MEPLSALSAAGNILQFVEFAFRLLLETRTIYKSANGLGTQNTTLSLIAKDTYDLCDAISALVGAGNSPVASLLDEGQQMAAALLNAIHRLQAKGECTKWKSFKTALKQIWSQKDIDEFAGNLVKIQTQLASRMQMLLLSNVSELHQTIARVEEENRRLDIQNRQELRQMKEDLIQSFKASSELVPQDDGAKESELQSCVRRSQQMLPINEETVNQLSAMLKSLATESIALGDLAKTSAMNQRFLRGLHFNQLRTRHRKIPRAHKQTFEWIFKPWLSDRVTHGTFLDWLRYGNGFYWIQGKAGSGKSTLMKFICQDTRTVENLNQWAGKRKLVTANFFFWNSGSKLQRSQEGLMRSLLFEVLRHCPELIPHAAAAQETEHLCSDRETEGWSAEELLDIFKAVLKSNTRTKFCFFIDGLDEYQDENRSCRDLLQTLNVLAAASENIKLCVSSRPWMIFADAFGENNNRFLKLEQLTQSDIRRYVTDKFHEDAQFRKLETSNSSCSDLIEEVVVRAQGVFLWVFLVVRDLLEGFTYHDTVATLRSRLLSFPPDLEQYFQHMMDSIPAFYRKKTAYAFRIAVTAPQPLLAMTYSFWDDVSSDPDFALHQPRAAMDKEEAIARQDRTRRQLDGRCKGLLEIVAEDQETDDYCRYRVDFLHRTVRDFITESNQIENMGGGGDHAAGDAAEQQQTDLGMELALCHCLVATLKRFPKLLPSRSSQRSYIDELIAVLLKLAHRAEDKARGTKQRKQRLITALEHAEESFIQLVSTRGRCSRNDGSRFLGLACQYDVHDYVEHRLTHPTRPFIPSVSPGIPLLQYALIGDGDESHLPSLRIVQLLLATAGGQPITEMKACWIQFLQRISRGEVNGELDPTSFEVIRLLVGHGAELYIKLPAPDSPRNRYQAVVTDYEEEDHETQSAIEVIQKAFPDASMLLESRPACGTDSITPQEAITEGNQLGPLLVDTIKEELEEITTTAGCVGEESDKGVILGGKNSSRRNRRLSWAWVKRLLGR